MSTDANGVLTENMQDRLVSDLSPALFSGADIPPAPSTAQFTKTNNAWSAVCVGDETPAETPFLITRNVDVGSRANAASTPKLTRILPFKQERAVWVTRGGGAFDARPKWLTGERLFPATNATYDVMYP